MNVVSESIELLERCASIANKFKSLVSFLAIPGFFASVLVAWLCYSSDSTLAWNLLKCTFVFVPELVICFVWLTLAQVVEAPEIAAKLADKEEGVVPNIKNVKTQSPKGVRGFIGALNTLRKTEGLMEVFDVIGGVTLIVNPIFLVTAFVSALVLLLFMLIAAFIVIL